MSNHKLLKPFMPLPWRLFKSIQGTFQKKNTTFLSMRNKIVGLLIVNFLFYLTMKKNYLSQVAPITGHIK